MRGELERCLSRVAAYQAFALGFGTPDDLASEYLAGGDGARRLWDLLRFLGTDLPWETPPAGFSASDLGERHAELFGHTVRGTICLYETEYGSQESLFQQPRELADIGGFLAAFGLTPSPSHHDRVDHLQCECEFMAFLCRKEAYAIEQGDDSMLAETRKAQGLFLADHLGRFGPAVGATVHRADPGGFYGSLGLLLQRFIEHDCKQLGVPAGPQDLRLRVAVAGDSSPAGGGAAGCENGGCTG